jgi:hypothetical protein
MKPVVGQINVKVEEMLSPKKDHGYIGINFGAGLEFKHEGEKIGSINGDYSGKAVLIHIYDEDGGWTYSVSNENIWQAVYDLHLKRKK